MRSIGFILASPVACLVVMSAIAVDNRAHPCAEDAAKYHATVKAALEAWPKTIRDDAVEWTSVGVEMPQAVFELLHPNVLSCRHYDCVNDPRKNADLLIVQCMDPNDMSGHYPRNCYPGRGQSLACPETPRTWDLGNNLIIRGMEYHFNPRSFGEPAICVYNFFVLPGKGIVPDMEDVQRASANYRLRDFGAAQFQLVFSSDALSQETRDEVFFSIVGAGSRRICNSPEHAGVLKNR